ncbi:MAG: HAD hydrolase-like protein [Polyangiaceae bacterium]
MSSDPSPPPAPHTATSPLVPLALDVEAIVERHAAVLLDAYGVLVDGDGPLPGAREFLEYLHARSTPFLIVTNDASRSHRTMETRFRGLGLPVSEEAIVSSGSLVAPWIRDASLGGARCVVLGTEDSKGMVREGGGVVVPPDAREDLDALFVCDESGFPFLDTLDTLVSQLFRAFERGRRPRLVLPNPDLLYPKRGGEFGLAAGTIAAVIESALAHRFGGSKDVPDGAIRFERLGKPYRPIFEAALAKVGTRDAVMFGDQHATDVRGANDAGIPSVLVASGLTRKDDVVRGGIAPTYVVDGVALRPRT